ncbi:MAG TPA: aspartyl protease family protein [Steroidobacteraceae bacterium]|jgi:predicted aspartyl protease|nr:aspartyl protease family protein [Steroidobacteraceae bacterium]
MLRVSSLLLAGMVTIGAAEPQDAATGSRVEPAPSHAVPADDLLYASPTRLDHIGRIVAPVMVNGEGPFRFIIDTGATGSTVSPSLAQTLGLAPAAGPPVQVHGITGTADVPSVLIRKLQAGRLLIRDTRFPVVWAPLMAGSDGILGVAGLRGKRLSVDFRHNRVTISDSTGSVVLPGYDRIPARMLDDGLLVVQARVAGVRVDAVIDTGSERSIGNNALRDALAWERRKGAVTRVTDVYGATRDVASGQLQTAPTVDFGSVKIANLSLVYGNFHIFQVWGMESHPAMIIGMDVLGTLNAFTIDFERSELYVDSMFHLG